MTNGNPFYVHPGGDYGPGLTGLANTMGQIGERKRKEEAEQKAADRFAEIKRLAFEAYQSDDPDKMAAVSLMYPELGQAVIKASGFKNERTQKSQVDSLISIVMDDSDENIDTVIEERDTVLDEEEVPIQNRSETEQFKFDVMKYKEKLATEGKEEEAKKAKEKIIKDAKMKLATILPPAKYKQAMEAAGMAEKKKQTQAESDLKLENELTAEGVKVGKTEPQARLDAKAKIAESKRERREEPKGTWGQPKEGIDESGNPVSYVTDKEGNVKVLEGIKPSPKKGMKIYDRDGNIMVDMSGGGESADLPRGVKTGLFKDVFAGQETMDELGSIKTMYEPEFLTYGGMYTAVTSKILNKMDPENRNKFSQRRAKFMSAVNQSFIRYRKWATGVAGGEKEMAEIKRSVPNEDDSPQEFEAKLRLRENITRRLLARQKAALAAGVENEKEYKKYISDHTLSSILSIQERGDQLENMGYNKPRILAILAEEGYIFSPKGGD